MQGDKKIRTRPADMELEIAREYLDREAEMFDQLGANARGIIGADLAITGAYIWYYSAV